MDESNELVQVLDFTVKFLVPGKDGGLAQERYTVREHEGDSVAHGEGALTIRYAAKDVKGQRLPGRSITFQLVMIAGYERDVRLEPKVRKSVASLVNPVAELKEKAGVVLASS